ncbi:uncharacterized protein LOC117294559 [Asterias rubens]|uniref:uncharacterized protein LOC117294559 n=1 Tax=Asterias rubens TaxID=7604 RepID=UPI001455AEA3|nr:uncharacterized protein LOC117294559 [Asterias rubens]
MDSTIISISDSEEIVEISTSDVEEFVETIDLTSDNNELKMLGLNHRYHQGAGQGHQGTDHRRHGADMEMVCMVDTSGTRAPFSNHDELYTVCSSPSTPYDCDVSDQPFESMLPGSRTQTTPVSATKTLERTCSKEDFLDAPDHFVKKKKDSKKNGDTRKNGKKKIKSEHRLKKRHRHNSNWQSSDSDFDEEISPKKPSFARRHMRSPQGKPAAMVSLSRPVSSFPSSLCLEFDSINHGYTTEKFSDDSDLQDTSSFLCQAKRPASPMLVERYSSPKGEKRPINHLDDQSFHGTPVKKPKLAVSHQHSLDKCSPADLPKSALKETTTLMNIRKTFLSLSDFSNSDEDFEPLDKRVMQTPSKQSWLKRPSPSKCKGSGLPRLYRREEKFVGVPIHIQVKESNCEIQNSEKPALADGKDPTIQTGVSEPSCVLPFCQRQRDLVEAVMEEDFNDEAISFIRDFTTLHRGAPEEYMMYLLKDVMLADKMETSTVLNAYGALMHIQNLHPASAATFSLDWDLVTSVIKRLSLQTETLDNPQLAYVLAFQFIVHVVMEDFQNMQTNNTPIKSFSHDLLSTDKCLGHVRDIIEWICQIIKKKFKKKTPSASPPAPSKPDQAEDRNIFAIFQQIAEPSDESSRPAAAIPSMGSSQTVGCGSYYTVLKLLQKLLVLSFAEGKSISALRIAEEFVYPYLYIPSLDQRKLCLQTLTCDPVRAKAIELLLENLCDASAREEQQGVLTVRKIVECHFRSRPMRVSEFVEVEADTMEGGAAGNKIIREERMAECEELAMLLFFLLQSYIRTKRARYHSTSSHSQSHDSQNTTNSQNCHPSESSSIEHWLSADDRECLWQMGDHVEALGGHLRCHCDRLTPRTKLYLAQIECLREMAC